jgi:hypothetical protein
MMANSLKMMANSLNSNTSVSHIQAVLPPDQTLYSALATALLSISTMRNLLVSTITIDDDHVFSPVLLALGKNTHCALR